MRVPFVGWREVCVYECVIYIGDRYVCMCVSETCVGKRVLCRMMVKKMMKKFAWMRKCERCTNQADHGVS